MSYWGDELVRLWDYDEQNNRTSDAAWKLESKLIWHCVDRASISLSAKKKAADAGAAALRLGASLDEATQIAFEALSDDTA